MITTNFIKAMQCGTATEQAAELNRLLKISIAATVASGMFANPKSNDWRPDEVVADAMYVASTLMQAGSPRAKPRAIRKSGRDS